MPIAKGEEWGQQGELPVDAPVATGDAEAAALVGSGVRTIGLDTGDLARTLGVRRPYDRHGPKQLLPVDAVQLELDDGTKHVCIAHVIAGNLRLGAAPVAIMNAAFIGPRNIAPRAHPGDGKVDVVRLGLEVGDRLQAWKRMLTGTHVPHPGIEIRQRTSGRIELARRQRVRVDGRLVGKSRSLQFDVIPSAIVVAVS